MDMIADERRTLADLLEGLDDEQLRTPSLCGDWTVHEVAGHLLMPLVTPLRVFIAGVIVARGNFDRANDRITRSFAQRPINVIAAGLRDHATSTFHPPGFSLDAPLTELLIHGQDIRRPLGLTWPFPETGLVAALTFLASPRAARGFVDRNRIAGLSFEATDVGWTGGVAGGPTVRGPAAALAYAMAGRTAALDELGGPGLDVLRAR
jgi:uncharacterized protein (TIGR03083 family)